MSFIRMNENGSHIEIPGGSTHYIYDNGRDISGWTHSQFSAIIGQVAHEIDIETETADKIQTAFREHFGGWEPDYNGSISRPERAEIFCRCVNSRIDGLELTDEIQTAVEQWVDEFDALRECKYCGEDYRPFVYFGEDICGNNECEERVAADRLGVSVETLKQAEENDSFENEWEYIVEHSNKQLRQ